MAQKLLLRGPKFRRLVGSFAVIAFLVFVYARQFGGPDVAQSGQPSGEVLEGRASVIDGDTIEIRGERVRFNGIDAPESDQVCTNADNHRYRCGAKAAEFLQIFLQRSSPTRCEFVSRDRYGRFVGNCVRADGESVAAALVRNGHALDWPKYSGGEYAAFQAEAKAERLGLWSGEFEPPWEYRGYRRRKQN